MKRTLAFLLCLVMVFALAACGSEAAPEITAAPETTAASETTTAPETTVPPTTEAAKTMDTSWASNEFETLIPQPPFAEMVGEESGSTRYRLSTEPATLDYSAESEDRAALDGYIASLEDYGFIVYPVGYSHPDFIGAELPDSWTILDTLGNKFGITLTCDDHANLTGSCIISITRTNGTLVDTEAMGGAFADLPDSIWTSTEEVTESFGFLFTQFIDRESVVAYGDFLTASGYTCEEGEPYMSYIFWNFTNENGDVIDVKYEGDEDFGTCRIKLTLAE